MLDKIHPIHRYYVVENAYIFILLFMMRFFGALQCYNLCSFYSFNHQINTSLWKREISMNVNNYFVGPSCKKLTSWENRGNTVIKEETILHAETENDVSRRLTWSVTPFHSQSSGSAQATLDAGKEIQMYDCLFWLISSPLTLVYLILWSIYT